ncbi:copper resistance protein CopC [Streptomyces sp. L2]|uniref:copper resistance CopC/CopD family protein n=1 Tax=Streptomyces sp. L2 TaxID=2162665 RepID=UPI001F506C3B|nr:copper resistance protein CopC [Streptomyces sp. L2]
MPRQSWQPQQFRQPQQFWQLQLFRWRQPFWQLQLFRWRQQFWQLQLFRWRQQFWQLQLFRWRQQFWQLQPFWQLQRSGLPLRRAFRALVPVAGVLLVLLGTAGPASAHAALRGTDPADGTLLKAAPRQLTLTYTESVGLLDDSFRLYDPHNRRVRTGRPDHVPDRPDTVRVPLTAAKLGKGTYTLAWRVVSADSHPVSGALTFSVGTRTATTPIADPDRAGNGVTTGLYNIARYLAYLSVALLLGTAAFVAYCRPPRTDRLRRPVRVAWWTLVATAAALFLLRAPYEEGASPLTGLTGSALARTATTRPGELLLARVALLALAAGLYAWAGSGRRRPALPRPVLPAAGLALAVALSLTWSAAEHASAGLQVPVAITAATLHVLAMSAWLGGLTALLVTLAHTPPPPVVTRFSRLAFASVTVLVVTGVYQSWRGLGSWQALTDTTYGRTLLAKLVAVTLLLTAAAWSRRWTAALATARRSPAQEIPAYDLIPQPAGGSPVPLPKAAEGPSPAYLSAPAPGEAAPGVPAPASAVPASAPGVPAPASAVPASAPGVPAPAVHDRLRRSVLVEVAVGVVVLVLTTLLTTTVPGRAAAEAVSSPDTAAATGAGIPTALVTTVPFDAGTTGGRGKLQITLDPGRVGTGSVQVIVYGADGGLAAVPELRLTLTLAARKIGPLDTRITDRGGYWAADSFTLPLAGDWTVNATVRVSELDQVTVHRVVRVTG